MKMNSWLIQFILEGTLGGLTIGARIQESRNLFGPSDDPGEGIAKIKIDAYLERSLQIAHLQQKVVLIAMYFDRGVLNDLVAKNLFLLDLTDGISTHKQKFMKWLDSQGVSHTCRSVGEDEYSIDIADGASVGFDSEGITTIQIGG